MFYGHSESPLQKGLKLNTSKYYFCCQHLILLIARLWDCPISGDFPNKAMLCNQDVLSKISGFRRCVVETSALLGCYAA
jgi:hypothetical protein